MCLVNYVLLEVKIIFIADKVKKVGANIKKIRIEKALSQKLVAKRLGISQPLLSNIEAGRSTVTIVNLFKLQEVLDCPMDAFFSDIFTELDAPKHNKDAQLEKIAELLSLLKK